MNQPNRSWLLLGLVALFTLSNCTGPTAKESPRKLEILLLGHDSEHHNSAAYLPFLSAALSPKGFNFSYTADLSDLNTTNLALYDALMIYANHDEISDEQEKALLQFVRGGGALLPIHSASYCFRNSEAYVQLVGGQFKSHETATFTAEVVSPDHPAMQGFEPFETWDETYVHTAHNPEREVLMERVEGDHREPYTWVRKLGKGRMFYTALGHDERTWSQPGFHSLLERGILWAVGEEKASWLDSLSFPERTYSEAVIPNYEQRDPPPQLQAPLTPEASQKLIQIPPGFELQLFAAEPDIVNPICMNWDEKGRLWLVETRDYPNEINTENLQGNDRIKILEDTDGDGKADKFTVFAEQLSVPTSLVFYNGGVIVSQAPHFLFLKDTDGDDKADVREVIMKGWGTRDTHAGPSNLQYGFDNQIWGVVGYSAFDGVVGEDTLNFGQAVYRFQPDGSAMELMGTTSNNTWGLGFSETFDVFVSTANNTHSAYLGIPHRQLAPAQGLYSRGVQKIDGHYAYHPITRNFRQVDVFGGFTAAAGHQLYTARSYPKEYWNRIALVCEPTGHLLHRAVLEKDGAGFQEKDGWNLLASVDEWVSPVQASVGPDGAVWILDWYNFIIQHNPTPPGFENGLGNAHVNPLRDKQHGRIYRLAYKKAPSVAPPDFQAEAPATYVDGLRHPNLLWRMHAQRLLVERGQADVVKPLLALIEEESLDEIGLNSPAVHALWTLHGLDQIREDQPEVLTAVQKALSHPAAGVRKAAIMCLPPTITQFEKLSAAKSFHDPDPHTRLAAINWLFDLPKNDQIGEMLFALSEDPSLQEDDWLARSVYTAAVKHKESFSRALAKHKKAWMDAFASDQAKNWEAPDLSDEDWEEIPVPMLWGRTGIPLLDRFDGTLWYRTSITVDERQAGKAATLHLGPIDETDDTYLNGQRIGGLKKASRTARSYAVPRGLLQPGENSLAVRVLDESWRGGIYGDSSAIYLAIGTDRIPLAGTWKYKVEKVIRSSQSVFNQGISIQELFMEHYGPYSQKIAANADSAPVDREIVIKTVEEQMKYDQEEIQLKPGERVAFLFENVDAMQHNLLIGAKGSLEIIGQAADQLAQGQGDAQDYIPAIPQVLAATPLVNPGESYRLVFTVPTEPGEYPFVCTFPGHWRMMNGKIIVAGGI